MRPANTRCNDDDRLIRPTSRDRFVTDDEVADYLRRVEAARDEFRRITGRSIHVGFTVKTTDPFDVSSKSNPF